jgi:hypothetical protein
MVANPFGRIYVESEDRLELHEDPPWITYAERAATVKMEGLRIPVGQWIVIEEEGPERRPSDEMADRVFERYWQLSGKLREVFHEDLSTFSFPPDEYRYANRLLRFDPDLYDEPTRQVADVFIQLAERKLSPSELTQRLDAILSRPDREKLLDELSRKRTLAGAPKPVQATSLEALRDLFYNFVVDVEQYQYAQQLFAIEKGLLDDSAKRLIDVYVQVAEGKLNPAELTRGLDEILSKADREGLLKSLQKRQSAGKSPDNGE